MNAGYGLTDVGRRRQHNEDAYLIDDARGLYVVADGVGGHAKGEVASAESVDAFDRGRPLASRNIPAVAAAGAVSRPSMSCEPSARSL